MLILVVAARVREDVLLLQLPCQFRKRALHYRIHRLRIRRTRILRPDFRSKHFSGRIKRNGTEQFPLLQQLHARLEPGACPPAGPAFPTHGPVPRRKRANEPLNRGGPARSGFRHGRMGSFAHGWERGKCHHQFTAEAPLRGGGKRNIENTNMTFPLISAIKIVL